MVARLHYNWKYEFLRPTVKAVVDRYNRQHHPDLISTETA
jgi:hypothetical protein